MPILIDEVPQWFANLSDKDFDEVCVSAVFMALFEEVDAIGEISDRRCCLLLNAMRERYRKMLQRPLCIETPNGARPSATYANGEQDRAHPSTAA